MNYEESIVAWLLADAMVQQYLGDRIFPGVPKQGTPGPYLVYRESELTGGYFLHRRHNSTGVEHALEVWDTDAERCKAAADAIMDRLDDARGIIGAVTVQAMRCSGAGADEQQDDSGNDTWWYRRRLKLTATYVRNR